MSRYSEGPGWWVGSDGTWYPPEQALPGAERFLVRSVSWMLSRRGILGYVALFVLGAAAWWWSEQIDE